MSIGGDVVKGVITGVITAALLGGAAEYLRSDSDRIRRNMQGVWVLESTTVSTSYQPYRDLRVLFVATLTVDANYGVTGVVYKVSEQKPNTPDLLYEREARARGAVSGSVIRDQIVMNWDSMDKEGRRSLQTFQGFVDAQGGQARLRGRFLSDVGDQVGPFCGRRIELLGEKVPEGVLASVDKDLVQLCR